MTVLCYLTLVAVSVIVVFCHLLLALPHQSIANSLSWNSDLATREPTLNTLHRTLTILCCFAVALLFAWKILHVANYNYSFWYSQLSIDQHIAKFAPQNRHGKTGFEKTTVEQRTELFRAIGRGVNNSGEGLRSLEYQPHPEAEPIVFLTPPEATHLEDVAKLIDLLEPIGWAATALLFALVVIALFTNLSLPGLSTSLLTLLVIALLMTIVILAVGPHDVFRALHEFVFPADHQWFFYYQDSLMTTLMKAPDIFYAIGAAWALLAVVIYLLITLSLRLLDRTKT